MFVMISSFPANSFLFYFFFSNQGWLVSLAVKRATRLLINFIK